MGDPGAAPAVRGEPVERPAPEAGAPRLARLDENDQLLRSNRRASSARAIYSPTQGHTRSNYELARVLLALGRPRDAVAVLEPALRGPLDGSNLYVTRTELQELLGRALDAAGEPDKAAAYFQKALAAWRSADPQFLARREAIRVRLSRPVRASSLH